MILNPSFTETSGGQPAGWKQCAWGSPATFSVVEGASGHPDDRAGQVVVANYVGGDAKWCHAEIPVSAGQPLFFSDRYRATVSTHITAAFRYSGGAPYKYLDVATPEASAGWTKASAAFFAPPDTATGKVVGVTVFHLIKDAGMLAVDDYYLAPNGFGRGMVAITFDDGYLSQLEAAVPMLDKYGFKGVFYIISRMLQIGGNDRSIRPRMNAAQVFALQKAGHEIGSHTRTHPDFGKISPDAACAEIDEGLSELYAAAAAKPGSVKTFSYPFGSYSAATDACVQKAGFAAARISNPGFNMRIGDRFHVLSQSWSNGAPTSVGNTRPVTVDMAKEWIDTAAKQKLFLVLMFHQVESKQESVAFGDPYGITPDEFSAVIDYLHDMAVSGKVRVVTVAQGADLMRNP
jgi:peptidoglycan/xylan/chitin deacetylase (PgdA/CDA1 family)